EVVVRHAGSAPVVALDDEMHAHERTFGEEGREILNTAIVGFGQNGPDPRAYTRREAIARNEHQDGDEPLELFEACEDPHIRPQFEVDDAADPIEQELIIDLEQLIARE